MSATPEKLQRIETLRQRATMLRVAQLIVSLIFVGLSLFALYRLVHYIDVVVKGYSLAATWGQFKGMIPWWPGIIASGLGAYILREAREGAEHKLELEESTLS